MKFTAAQAAQKFVVIGLHVQNAFTAAQAAQKCTGRGMFALLKFTAAQAAQKLSVHWELTRHSFATAQAAQKQSGNSSPMRTSVTVVQAAQKADRLPPQFTAAQAAQKCTALHCVPMPTRSRSSMPRAGMRRGDDPARTAFVAQSRLGGAGVRAAARIGDDEHEGSTPDRGDDADRMGARRNRRRDRRLSAQAHPVWCGDTACSEWHQPRVRISANVTDDFGNVTGLGPVLGCADLIVEMESV